MTMHNNGGIQQVFKQVILLLLIRLYNTIKPGICLSILGLAQAYMCKKPSPTIKPVLQRRLVHEDTDAAVEGGS